MKLAGSAIGLAALSSAGITTITAGEPSNTVNLADEGLSPGDQIDPYLEEFWTPGNHVIIPGGTYEFDGDGLDGTFDEDSWLQGDGEVILEGHGDHVDDMVAENGAHVRWQNITVKGEDNTGGNQPMWAGEDSILEFVNYNRPDGGGGRATGLWLRPDHAGTARFINCTVMNFSDNGIYGSAFAEGGSGDGMGVIEIWGGYYAHNGVNELRIGGDNAKIIGATVVCDEDDAIRIREAGENILIHDVDLVHDGSDYPIYVTNHKFKGPGPNSATISNCRIENQSSNKIVKFGDSGYDMEGTNLDLTGGGDYEMDGGPYDNVVTDSDAEEPDTSPQVYDPNNLSVDGATTGSEPSGSDSTDSDTTDEESTDTTEFDHNLVIQTADDSGILYSFTVDGAAEMVDQESNDSVTENSDGTVTAAGETGNGFTDEWSFNGQITAWSAEQHPDNSSGEYELVLDGSTVSPEDLGGESSSGSDSTDSDSDSTDSGSGSGAPTIENYAVTEAKSPNSSVDIVAKWNVADADGDLAWVLVQVSNENGFVVDASKAAVSGDTAAGVDYFQIENVQGQTFDVEVTVSDAAGNTATDTQSVTESAPYRL
jgi:hypothetical protein